MTDEEKASEPASRSEGVGDERAVAESVVDIVDGQAGQSRCFDAFTVALNEASDGNHWYVPTLNLQLASLQFCIACRGAKVLHARADSYSRWRPVPDVGEHRSSLESKISRERAITRVPRVRPRGLTWNLPFMAQTSINELFGALHFLFLGDKFNGGLEGVVWPQGLTRLSFGVRFNQPLDRVDLPVLLEELTFGHSFNQPIDNVVWPAHLRKLTFGSGFNQAVDNMPAALQQLIFGDYFNQPIKNVVWPVGLLYVAFGEMFSHALDGFSWPDSIRTMKLGRWCTEALDDVHWPVSLQQLTLGDRFNRAIDHVVWPASLQDLSVGERFNRPIHNARWPASLQTLVFGYDFNRPIDGVAWPPSLRQLTFGACFNQAVDTVEWPRSLEHLEFGYDFNRPIDGVAWPSSLRKLTLAEMFEQPLQGETALPVGLEELILKLDRGHYSHSLVDVRWPVRLKRLVVSDGPDLDALGLPEGTTLLVSGEQRGNEAEDAGEWLLTNSFVVGAA